MEAILIPNLNTKVFKYLIIGLSIAVFLFQIVAFIGIQSFEWIGFMLIALLFSISSKIEVLLIIMYLLPSNQYINLGSTSIITILVTIYIIKYFSKGGKILKSQLLLGILLLLYSVVFHEFESLPHVVKTIIYLVFCWIVFTDDEIKLKETYVYSIKFLSLGIIIPSIFSLIINPNIINERFSLTPEQSINTLAMLIAFTLINILMMIQNKNYQIEKKWIMMCLLLSGIGFLTQSRQFLIGLVMGTLWLIIFSLYKENSKFRIFKLILIVSLILIIILFIFPQLSQPIMNALERVTKPRNDDLTGGRAMLWKFYNNEIINNINVFLTGTGRNVSPTIDMLPHNLYIEEVYHFGIIGSSLVFMLFTLTIKSIYKSNKSLNFSLFGLLPLLLILLNSFFTHSFVGSADSVRFIIASFTVGLYKRNKNDSSLT